MEDKQKDTLFASLFYVPYAGIAFSLFNFFITNKNTNKYRVFHMYHSFFYWISIFLFFLIISFFSWLVCGIPLIGKFIVHIFSSIKFLIHAGSSIAGLFMAYMVFQGTSFNIPYLTEYTSKYLSDKHMLS